MNAKGYLSAGSSSKCDQCVHTYVHSAANVTFTSPKQIKLLPGFTSENGSTFKASLTTTTSLKSQYIDKAKLSEAVSDEISVNAYPNPNDGIFTIDFGNQQMNSASIIIYDSYGHEIKKINTTSSKETIDLSNESNGVYLVQILSNKRFKTFKIVKEKNH